MTDPLSVVALTDPDRPGRDHWRIVRPFRRLQQAAVDAHWYPLDAAEQIATDPDETVLVVSQLGGTDAAAIDRWFDVRRPRVRAIVYETDDDCWSPACVENLVAANFQQGKTVEQLDHDRLMAAYFARHCDGVTVSSEPLADLARQITDKPVIVVPNALDVRWFRSHMAHRPPWADRLTIGWAGGPRAERDLAPMAEAWGRIAQRYADVSFVVCAPIVPDAIYRHVEDDSRIIRLSWLPVDEYPTSMQVDIGCCAVADTPFNACKTPIKAMEYAIGGATVVATPALYSPLVEHGVTGLLAETTDEWETALACLLESEQARRRLSIALTLKVERACALDRNVQAWPRAYRAIVEAKAGVTV